MVLLGAEISGALVTHGTAVNWETKGEWRLQAGWRENVARWSKALRELTGVVEQCMGFTGMNMEYCKDFTDGL